MRVALIRLLLGIFSKLSLRASHRAGAFIGFLLAVVPNDLRRVTDTNLRLCFPRMPPRERKNLARLSLIEVGKTFTETATLWDMDSVDLLALVKGAAGEKAAEAEFVKGRGVIVGVPHLGAWEFLGLYYSARGFPLNILYRPPRLPQLQELVTMARERLGAHLVPATPQGIRSLYAALKRGEIVAILPDQEPGRGRGVFAPFFGVDANTMVLLSRLAQKSGAPVFFGYAERLPDGEGYHLHFLPAPDEIVAEDLEQSANIVNEMVENCVRALPDQYQWGY
jgi:KDO2-lipid IV(A) lauroyltransferase